LIDHLNVSAGWAIPAELDHGKNDFFGPRKQRLDAAVPAVAHPAFDPEFEGGDFGPGAKAYALHATTDDDLEDHVQSKSRTRAGLRCLERSQINAAAAWVAGTFRKAIEKTASEFLRRCTLPDSVSIYRRSP